MQTPAHNIRRVLACVTLSPHGPAVVRGARWLAAAYGAELRLLHVGNDTPEHREALAARLLARSKVDPETLVIRPGAPEEVILAEAAAWQADLVFLGALEQEQVYRELVGSTARRVARWAPCSVLLLAVGSDTGQHLGRSVVAAVDVDARPALVLGAAAPLARAAGGMLHVLSEYNVPDALAHAAGGAAPGDPAAFDALYEASEGDRLAGLLAGFDLGGVRLTAACRGGRHGAEAARYAVEVQAELLLVEAPDRRLGWWDRFLGHPAEIVLQKLPCSVMLCRARRGGAS